MFLKTHTAVAPWTIVKSDDRMRGRISAMRHMPHIFDYEGNDPAIADAPDPSIVASAGDIYAISPLAREFATA